MKRKRSKISKAILFALEKTVWVGTTLYDFAQHTNYYVSGMPLGAQRYEFYQAVRRLREEGFIDLERKIDENKVILKLTEHGKYSIKIEQALINKDWDGKWRLVIFDIPEKQKRLRNTLRQKLKEWGFKYWQKSLWATKKDLAEPLEDFIDSLGLSQWVVVAVTEGIKNNNYTKM